MPYSIEKAKEIKSYIDEYGIEKAIKHFGTKRSTLRRAVRKFNESETDEKKTGLLTSEENQYRQFCERFTQAEREMILTGSRYRPEQNTSIIDFDGEEVCVAHITDTHMGANHFSERYWYSAINECHKRGVQVIMHTGDLTEGMSHRPDQIYSLTHIGSSAQIDYARKLLSEVKIPIKIIDGNHDRWSIAATGLHVVKEICRGIDGVEFIGNDFGHVMINDTDWMLQHGNDAGGAYSRSYRAQKKVEAFKPGLKPNVLLLGHDHKQNYMCVRNVHTVQGGALCMQSEYMRSTGKENCDGFWIIKAGIKDREIKWFEPRFYPFY